MHFDKTNPFHPIKIDDYPKLFDYVLTLNGLIYFHILKRNYILGKEMNADEYNKLRLLYAYYATANRNLSEVFSLQDICITLDERGFFEKDMYQSKEDLKNKSLIVINPQYSPGLYRKYTEYVKGNLNFK